MIQLANVHPLTDFLRNAKSHLKRLEKGGPMVLTVNGRVAAVLDSPASYQRLMEARDRMESGRGNPSGLGVGRTREGSTRERGAREDSPKASDSP